MPRKKTQAQLDAMPTKNQQTQCNTLLLYKDSRDFGVQAFERSDLVYFQPICKGLVKEYRLAETQTNVSFCFKTTQTEIFGFNVSSEKWEELNSVSNVTLRKYTCKRKLIDTGTRYETHEPKRLTGEDTLKASNQAEIGSYSPVGVLGKETAMHTTLGAALTTDPVLNTRDVLPLALLAIKEFIETSAQAEISIRRLKTYDGLLEYFEVSLKDGLLPITTYYDVPRRLLFSSKGKLSILTLFMDVDEFDYFNFENGTLNSEIIINALTSLSEKHVFCTGIPKETATGMENTKRIKTFYYPFERYQSVDCLAWFVPPANASKEKIEEKLYPCSNCSALNRYITDMKKKKEQVTPRTKLKRRSVESRCPISLLTPKSKKSRLEKNRRRRSALVRKVKDLENKIIETSLKLSKDQDKQMREIVSEINLKGKKDLENIFEEAVKKNKIIGQALKMAWDLNTKAVPENDFLKDQENCITGSHGNKWSPLTYRIALCVFSRSPAAYEALASFDVLKLPSIHTLRAKVQQIDSKAGIDMVHLKKESKRFDQFLENHPEYGNPPKEGALIFDEVKLIGKLMWNSNNGEYVGAALDLNEYASLEDLYKVKRLSSVLEAEYALQYLWRCTSTAFDIIGPYFMFAKPVTHAEITSTLMQTVYAFHLVGLETGILVCDGGSSNMSTLRHSLGVKKAQEPSSKEDGSLNFQFNVKFRNWWVQGAWIYWLVCPSHQLKNMINALNHSQPEDTRDFTRNNVKFGWKQIIDMKKREDDRRDNHELVQVKGLQQSYVDRDSWTKLNVTPARIMQQMEVMGELFNYANPMFEEMPADKPSVMACYEYLNACHDIFEGGLLSKNPVHGLDSTPIKSMLKGLKYFENWAAERITDKEKLTNNPKFLAWQTFELLRISVYGFVGYVEDFLTRHPSRYIYPVRINGSAVETLFSQMKYGTAGKLTSVNYISARRALLIKGCTKSSQNAEASYRKVGLDVCGE